MTTGGWGAGRDSWLTRQPSLRTVVRQDLVTRQLAAHLPPTPGRVLDVGAGQGTQAVRLARVGHQVLGIEPDPVMREAFSRTLAGEPDDVRGRVRIVAGSLPDLPHLDPGDGPDAPTGFDLVCCHGVLMYLDDPRAAILALCERVAPGGTLSILARNADSLALRPASAGRWDEVQRMLDESRSARPRYVNGLGVSARADRLEELASWISGRRMHVEQWYGVRVLTDGAPADQAAPDDPAELAALLAAEERVGRTDPYRRTAPLLHLVARRRAGTDA